MRAIWELHVMFFNTRFTQDDMLLPFSKLDH